MTDRVERMFRRAGEAAAARAAERIVRDARTLDEARLRLQEFALQVEAEVCADVVALLESK